MKLLAQVDECLHKYYVTADHSYLLEAVALIETESVCPKLCSGKLTLTSISLEEALESATREDFLELGINDATNEGQLIKGRFVRIFAPDSTESCLVMRLASVTNDGLVLVPFKGLGESA